MDAYKGKATAALVLGIIGVALAWFGYAALGGLVCSIIALVLAIQIKKAGQAQSFEVTGAVKAAFVLGIIGVILNALMFVICVVVAGIVGAAVGAAGSSFNALFNNW